VAGRIIQTTKQQYLANDIPLSRFVTLGIDVCPSVPVMTSKWSESLNVFTILSLQLEDAPHDYQSLVDALSHQSSTLTKMESIASNGVTNHNRVLNKRLSRVILYGRRQEDLVDRRTILQRCVEEIGRVRDSDKSECGEWTHDAFENE
jgi:hypothetical protein